MAIRPIDGDELLGITRLLDTDAVRQSKTASWLLDQVLHDIQAMPTLTPPNEWVSVEERLPEESDGMVLLTDGISVRTGYRNWMFRMDDYPIVFVPGQKKGGGEMAVTHWMKISAPPNRRPPEGEEDT